MNEYETVGGMLRSSQDGARVSLTIKGLMLQIIPIVLLATHLFGIEGVDEGMLTTMIDVMTNLISVGIEFVSLMMIAWGLIRKVLPTAQNLEDEFGGEIG